MAHATCMTDTCMTDTGKETDLAAWIPSQVEASLTRTLSLLMPSCATQNHHHTPSLYTHPHYTPLYTHPHYTHTLTIHHYTHTLTIHTPSLYTTIHTPSLYTHPHYCTCSYSSMNLRAFAIEASLLNDSLQGRKQRERQMKGEERALTNRGTA